MLFAFIHRLILNRLRTVLTELRLQRKRVHEREQLERSENIFLLETSGANVTFPKKFRKIAAEQPDLHQVHSFFPFVFLERFASLIN